MSLTSEEVNFLIYRYLQESGFQHTAFTFGVESVIHNSSITNQDVPPGALISFIQKGIQYLEVEANLACEDGMEVVYQRPLDLLKPSNLQRVQSSNSDATKRQVLQVDDEENSKDIKQATILKGHTCEVFSVAWNPQYTLLASGGADGTARMWTVPEGDSGIQAAMNARSLVLRHFSAMQTQEKNTDVTALDWKPDGSRLATGSYDGQVRIWGLGGELLKACSQHEGPIFSLKWNEMGNYLLSGSVDRMALIWDAENGEVVQSFAFHKGPVLEVDWKSDTEFATCSTDKSIYVCEVGRSVPVRWFQGHTDEVNSVKWSPSKELLASCSDDGSARIWSTQPGVLNPCLHDLRLHEREIYKIDWSPTGPGSANPGKPLMLATGAFDNVVALWDVETGKALFTLKDHTQPIYSVAFSPDGEYIASGSFDCSLRISSTRDGSLVKRYNGPAGIFDVCWSGMGDKVAACFSNSSVAVVDFRM